MKTNDTSLKSIDEYITGFPTEVQQILEKMRSTIRSAAPEAEEAIRYGMPTFRLNGNLVHFAAFKHHIGFFPAPAGIEEFTEETSIYRTGKGTLQFPLDKPIPYELITRIVEFRVKQNLEKVKTKKTTITNH